ncbi:hypothetical protein PR048_025613, partial [Dryococelus australis]
MKPIKQGYKLLGIADQKEVVTEFANFALGEQHFCWMDNKAVNIGYNFHGSETTTVTQTVKDGSKVEVKCPVAVSDYNKYMGGAGKWWQWLFLGLVDIAFVNSFVIYNALLEPVGVLEFRSVVQGHVCQIVVAASRKITLTSTRKFVEKKVRLFCEHWPRFIEKRSYSQCSHCKVHLCCNDKKNCFTWYQYVLLE